MSETVPLENERLVTAIEENPEAVAAFIERLDAVNELLDIIDLGTAAMDDTMVTELTGTAALLAESADGLATRETVQLAESVGEHGAELESALETLVELEQSGTLNEIAEMADAITLLTAALDDEMVTTLSRMGSGLGELADTASDPETVRGVETLLTAVGEASETETPPDKVGIIGLLKALRDPDVQQGLGFLIAIAAMTGQELDRQRHELI